MSHARRLDPSILKEYDIRGVIDQNLTLDDARAVGRAFGTRVAESGGTSVCLGWDGRTASPDFADAVAEGLTACGLEVRRIGRGPTPMLYYAVWTQNAGGGLMVTASHNPPEYNGFKMMLGTKSFYGEDIQRLGRIAAAGEFAEGQGRVVDTPVFDDYVNRLMRDYDGEREIACVWDPGNGAAGEVVTALCGRLPGRHIVINADVDGTFPNHHPDPTVPENLKQLQETVTKEGCEMGVAFDGDGDRIGVVDARGRILWGDQLMVLLARDLLKERPGATIIADVKASRVLFDAIGEAGGEPLMWRTGHSLIKSKMAELNAPLAGEMSGHLFFADRYYGFDDALYAAVRLTGLVSRAGTSLDQLFDGIAGTVATPEMRFPVPSERKFKVAGEIEERLKDDPDAEVNTIDGVRVSTPDGWWLLRASNTQDVLVARCEAQSQDGLERLKDSLRKNLEESGVTPPDMG